MPLKGNKISQEKPRKPQGRTGMRRRKSPIIQVIAQMAKTSKKIPETSKIEKKAINHPDFTNPMQSINNFNAKVFNRRPIIKDIPFYPDQTYRAPPKRGSDPSHILNANHCYQSKCWF